MPRPAHVASDAQHGEKRTISANEKNFRIELHTGINMVSVQADNYFHSTLFTTVPCITWLDPYTDMLNPDSTSRNCSNVS